MMIIPAVDIKGGKCVRLKQGRMAEETVFSDDPVAMAKQWDKMGAEIIHVVDLDGAIERRPCNLSVIRDIVAAVGAGIQVGGGIRNLDTIRRFLDIGVERVIIGTEAVRHPEWIAQACQLFPDRIIVGIDALNGMVAIEGWTETTRIRALDLARQFEQDGVAAINFTDIVRDGMQTGPNVVETARLAKSVSTPVVASGGVACLDDIRRLLPLAQWGVIGVITGRALYSNTLDFKQAQALARQRV